MKTMKELDNDLLLINYEVYPSDADNENSYALFYDSKINRFLAYERFGEENKPKPRTVYIYKLLKLPHELDKAERERVLNYNLAYSNASDEVTLSDIYLQGEFIQLIEKVIL